MSYQYNPRSLEKSDRNAVPNPCPGPTASFCCPVEPKKACPQASLALCLSLKVYLRKSDNKERPESRSDSGRRGRRIARSVASKERKLNLPKSGNKGASCSWSQQVGHVAVG